jgi:hypothetical protein
MTLSVDDLVQAKDAVGRLLEQLGLKAYLFEVEPSDDVWQVRIECATRDGWQTLRLEVDAPRLRDCATDSAARSEVLRQWRERLVACQQA